MPTFPSFDGLALTYQEEGGGRPVVLLHGFAASTDHNWRGPGVWRSLVGAGRRVIGLDARGHGASGKPHDPGAYADGAMSRDVLALFDHLGLDHADVAGYSMGAAVAMQFAADNSRVRRLVLGGTNGQLNIQGDAPAQVDRRRRIVAALLAEDPGAIDDPLGREFRTFADGTHADREALAAVMRAPERFGTPPDLSAITAPTLVICGDRDVSPDELAAALPNGTAKVVKGDHIKAVGDPAFAP